MRIPVQVCSRAQWPAQGLAVPAHERWAVLSDGVFGAGLLAADADTPGLEHHALLGCACCAGNLALRVTLGRLIRRGGYTRILIVVIDPDHRAGVLKVLEEAQFAPHLMLDPQDTGC